MEDVPADLRYTREHLWVRVEGDGLLRVGITDFAQQQLGDLVYVDLPRLGRTVLTGEQCVVVESVKTASELTSPVTGEIVAVNDGLGDDPAQVNETPYKAWIFCVKADDLSVLENLMNHAVYQQFIEQ